MNVIVIILAAVLFGSGIFAGIKQNPPEFENFDDKTVLSLEVTQTPEPSPFETTEPTYESTPSETPTPVSTTTSVPQTSLEKYKYPNSKVISSTSATLSLESSDNPDLVTNWYKDKIKSENMSVTSFVTTKANENVLNKLVGANGKEELRVEIKKSPDNSFVQITVSLRT